MAGEFIFTKVATCVTNLYFYLGLVPDMAIVNHIKDTNLPLFDQYTLATMAAVESGFDSKAVSSIGAKGILQLTPIAVDHVNKYKFGCVPPMFDYYDIGDNIKVAGCYFELLMQQYKSRSLSIAAYNGGGSSVKALRELRNLNTETANYITKVTYLRDEVCLYAPRYNTTD